MRIKYALCAAVALLGMAFVSEANAACVPTVPVARTPTIGSPFANRGVTTLDTQTSDNVAITGGCVDAIVNGVEYAATSYKGASSKAACTWDATHDVGDCIQAALNAASAAGGGRVVVPPGTYGQSVAISIPAKTGLVGGATGANQLYVSRLKWIGSCAAGTAQVTLDTGTSVSGVTLGNLMLDGDSCAGIGWKLRGLNTGTIFPMSGQRHTVSNIDIDGAADGTQDGQNLYIMSLEAVQDTDGSASGDGIRLGPSVNLNHGFIGAVRTRTKNGVGLHFVNADSMTIGQSFNQRISGGTGYGVKFDNGDNNTSLHPSLANAILAVDPGAGGVYVQGSATAAQSSRGHYIGFYNLSNGAAADTVDWSQGASLFIATTSSGRGNIAGLRATAFSGLPATPLEGMMAVINDASVNAAGDPVTAGGGGSTVLAMYRGTFGAGGAWRVIQTTITPNRVNLNCTSLATASALPDITAGQLYCINDSNTSTWGAAVASGSPNDTVLAIATSPTTFRVVGSVSGSPIRPQSVMFGGANLAAGTTTYVLPGASATASINDAAAIAPIAATARNLRVRVQTAPGVGQTYVITLNKGAAGAIAATSVTCTISGTNTTCNDLTNTASLAAGNQWNATIVASAGAAGTGVWGIGFEYDN